MPRYEYKCEKCGFEFEVPAKVGDPNPTCPNKVSVLDPGGNPVYAVGFSETPMKAPCGAPTQKLVSRTSFKLVGGGWAADGYSSGGED